MTNQIPATAKPTSRNANARKQRAKTAVPERQPPVLVAALGPVKPDHLYPLTEAHPHLGVSRSTIKRLVMKKVLPVVRYSPNGKQLIRGSDIIAARTPQSSS